MYQAVWTAIEHDDAESMAHYLADGADPTAGDSYMLRRACADGAVRIVRLLLADGRADPTAARNNAMENASCGNCVSVMRLLLADPRSNPSRHDNWTVRWAAYHNHVAMVRVLLADGRADAHDGIAWASDLKKGGALRAMAARHSRWFVGAKS